MLKQKLYSFIILFITIVLLSSVCFATDSNDEVILSEGTVEEMTNSSDTNVITTTEGSNVENNTSGENVAEGEESTNTIVDDGIIKTDYFKADTNVLIDQNMAIDGSAYIIGENVTINGRIAGDLFVVAKNLTIEGGVIYSNLFACASNIIIKNEGAVYNLYATGENLTVDTDGLIVKDLNAACSSVTIKGIVGRDAKISASSLSIIPSEASYSIFGNLNYSAPQSVDIPEECIQGEIKFEQTTTNIPGKVNITSKLKTYAVNLIKTLIITSLVFLFIAFLKTKFSEKATELLTKKVGVVIGLGFATLVGIPFVSVLLLFTIVGIPVSFILITIYCLLFVLSHSILSVVIADVIMTKTKKEKKTFFYLFTLATATVISLLQLIPYVGGLVTLAVVVLTLGICTRALFPNKKEKLAEPEVE